MASLLNEIADISQKYDKEEILLNKLLNDRIYQENQLDNCKGNKKIVSISVADAIKRNKELLKELEIVKGRLRSKAIFTSTEMQWEYICRKYQENPSLPAITWRCHLPVYV